MYSTCRHDLLSYLFIWLQMHVLRLDIICRLFNCFHFAVRSLILCNALSHVVRNCLLQRLKMYTNGKFSSCLLTDWTPFEIVVYWRAVFRMSKGHSNIAFVHDEGKGYVIFIQVAPLLNAWTLLVPVNHPSIIHKQQKSWNILYVFL